MFAIAKSFHLGFVIPFPCALFVDGYPLASGGVSSSIPLLRLGSALLLTPSVYSSLLFFFGLNHYYQSSLYRLNSNPPPTITLLYHAVVFSLPSCVKRQFRPSSQFITHPLTACRAILALFLHWFAIYPSRVLERTSAFQYFDFHLALYVASYVASSALAFYLAIFALLIGLHS